MNDPFEVDEGSPMEPIIPPATNIKRSEKIGALVGSLAKAQVDFEPILRTSDNPFYASQYADLAAVLDAYSRRVVGWALDCSLEAELALQALRMALAARRPASRLVHHSDRGVQYACSDYVALLAEHGIAGSMSRKGNPYDNAYAESFMKTLKYEEVYRNEYADLADARAAISEFIEKIYNRKRLHSALGHRPPVEFEQAAA